MQLNTTGKDLQALLFLYNQEIDKLKEKLLNGESWENLKPLRRNITELAIAIQKSHGYVVTDKPVKEQQAPTQFNRLTDQPMG